MRIAAAGLLLLADLAAFTWLARKVRRRPLPLSAAVGMGLLVAWQSVVVGVLSPLRAVTPVPLALAAALPPAVAAAWASRAAGSPEAALRRGGRAVRWALVGHGWPLALVLPLAVVLGAVAASYAPNNWDSMTYRLARVAHWLQMASAEPYATNVLRQIALTPGCEYLLLALQGISGSDRLANGVQLVSWGLVVLAAPLVARLAGSPRRAAAWAGPIVAGTPMLVLQATSTQNDLLASVLALAVGAATVPFVRRRATPAPGDVVLLATVTGAAFLVKAPAVSTSAPFLLVSVPGIIRSFRRWPARTAAATAAVALLGAALVAGPHAVRMVALGPRVRELAAPYTYPLLGEWTQRAGSVWLAATRHLPAPKGSWLDLEAFARALPDFHEDLAANPVQSAFAITGLLLTVLAFRRVPRRAMLAGAIAVAAWVLFQVSFRSNMWITRLESPLFALLPLTMGGWAAVRSRSVAQAMLAGVGLAAVATGLAAAFLNPSRPAAGVLAPRTAADDYYANRPEPRRLHDAALEAVTRTGCRRIGLYVGEDSYDYPLTWRAMQRGLAVRHVTGPDPWPCIVVSDRGPPPEGTVEAGGPWRPVLQIASGRGGPRVVAGGVWYRP